MFSKTQKKTPPSANKVNEWHFSLVIMEKKKKTGKFHFAEEKSCKSLLLQLLASLKAHIRVKSVDQSCEEWKLANPEHCRCPQAHRYMVRDKSLY